MSALEIFLSKNDLERIANGHDIKIKISHGRGSRINGVILKLEKEDAEELKVKETELEYYERMREMLPKYPTPFLSHAMAYVNLRIMHLKKEMEE